MTMKINDELGDMEILRPHKKLERNLNGQQIYALKFTDSEFDHIIFSYDRVQFIPDDVNDILTAKFNYTVHEHKGYYDKIKFEQELGDFLLELVADGISKNSLIYAGGIDESDDRTDNIT